MDTMHDTVSGSEHTLRSADTAFARWLSLAGVGYALLSIAGNLVIDKFPDETTTPAALVRYYAGHHAQVQRGGEILVLSTVFLGLFVAALAVRSRRFVSGAGIIIVGGTSLLAAEVYSASTYHLLGSIGAQPHVSAEALQAWHISGAAFGDNTGLSLFLLGVALTALVGRVLPAWAGWSALVLGIGTIVPGFGFFAAMLSLLWFMVVGIALAVRGPASAG